MSPEQGASHKSREKPSHGTPTRHSTRPLRGHFPARLGWEGEVYIAEDTKLSRKVALKVLPPEMAENAERRARFERDAKAVAALDHPNIVTIHSVEEAEGVHFYTMQLVKGKTLTELIPNKPYGE